MRKLAMAFSIVIILFCLSACANQSSSTKEMRGADDDTKALVLYDEFLYGERNISYVDDVLDINKIIGLGKEVKEDNVVQYAFFDVSGDQVPELHVRSQSHYYVINYEEGDLKVWANLTPYYKPLNNRAFLHTRSGGTPTHIFYHYIVMKIVISMISKALRFRRKIGKIRRMNTCPYWMIRFNGVVWSWK